MPIPMPQGQEEHLLMPRPFRRRSRCQSFESLTLLLLERIFELLLPGVVLPRLSKAELFLFIQLAETCDLHIFGPGHVVFLFFLVRVIGIPVSVLATGPALGRSFGDVVSL